MKKRYLHLVNGFTRLYLVFHICLLLSFLVVFVHDKRVVLDSDLLNMVPSLYSADSAALKAADETLSSSTSKNIIILVSHTDFSKAKDVALKVVNELEGSDNFASLRLHTDSSSMYDSLNFLHKYRFNILDEKIVNLLSNPQTASAFAMNAVAKAYSPISFSSVENIEEDPFLFDDYNFNRYLSVIQNSGMSLLPKESVLATEYQGLWYVFISGVLSTKGTVLASSTNGVAEVYSVCAPLERDGIRFIYSGTPFHSYASSLSASREITLISVFSLLCILFILLYFFRSPFPILFSVLSVLLSVISGFCATYVIFRKIHLLSVVFATSLIGCCIDYSLHFFVEWKADISLFSGGEIRKKLFKGLSLSLLSTEIGYFCLFFAPFPLLKQVAVFSFVGILSAYLSTVCIYPLLHLPQREKRIVLLLENVKSRQYKRHGLVFALSIIFISIAVILVNYRNVRVENRISKLYTPHGRLLTDTVLASEVLSYSPTAWFIVRGDSVEQVLEQEESFCSALKEKTSVLATSLFIPSKSMQKKSIGAVKKLFPLVSQQYEFLGFDNSYVNAFESSVDSACRNLLSPENELPAYLKNSISSLWLGKIGEYYYSLIIPSVVDDPESFKTLAAKYEGVYFENKVSDINSTLDSITITILVVFGLALFLVILIMKFFYSWKQVAAIISSCAASFLSVIAVFSLSGAGIDFFAVIGIILVFGLGLDYMIYNLENRTSNKLESVAIVLSFITTAISFGALAFSSFMPVHIIGSSIFVGLTIAFLCAVL